jgi:hypothetical protein
VFVRDANGVVLATPLWMFPKAELLDQVSKTLGSQLHLVLSKMKK